MNKTIAIIGAGISGLTSAYYLSKKGHTVHVYDKERYPAMKCSYANGGQISVSNSEVWNTWINVWKGIKWVLKKDAPLLIRPNINFDKAIWLAKFLMHTANNVYAKNTAQTILLGIQARKLYHDIIAEENLQFDQSSCGILHFYKDQAHWDWAQNVKSLYEDNGCEWNLLTPMQTVALDPALANIKGIIGGAWTPSDWTGDIHKFCVGLAEVLTSKYNVKFFYDVNVENLSRFDHYERIVIANGVGSSKLAKTVGDRLDVYPIKGYSVTIESNDVSNLPKVSLLDDQAKIVTSTLGNRLRIAGTAEITDENYDITRDRIEPLLNWVRVNFPQVSTKDYEPWACLRPMTPNMMPIVGQSNYSPRIYYHTGHGHLGWTLSSATAKKLADSLE